MKALEAEGVKVGVFSLGFCAQSQMRGVQGESDNHPNPYSLTRRITQAFWRRVRNKSPFHRWFWKSPARTISNQLQLLPTSNGY